VAQFYGSRGQFARAEGASRAGSARIKIALTGLARHGAEPNLWALVSESYVAKGDIEGAARAYRGARAGTRVEARLGPPRGRLQGDGPAGTGS
jgi:hypothetical protein